MTAEKAMDWVFKVTTALVIPTIVWTFKISNDVAVLKDRSSELQSKGINETATKAAVNEASIKGVKEKVDRISSTLDRIENYLRARSLQ